MKIQAKNFGHGTLGASMNDSQTNAVLSTGHGTRFPATTGGVFEVTIWDGASYQSAADAYYNNAAEIMLVTSHNGSADTFAVLDRAQGGTSAIAHSSGAIVDLTFTKTVFDWLVASPIFQYAPHFWDAASSASTGTPTSLDVFACPTTLFSQTVNKLAFNLFTNGTAGDLMAMGLYDVSGNQLFESTWQSVSTNGNKIKTLASAITVKSDGFYVAWSYKRAGAAFNIWGYALSNSFADIPFINHSSIIVGKAANQSTTGNAGDPALPATLGLLSAIGADIHVPIMVLT